MKIVILDGYTENPGDLSWEGIARLGELTVYDRTPKDPEEICRRIGVTPRHAQRVFRQVYGTSIHRFLLEEKLRKARTLLLYTDSSVTQIAAEAGFANEKYFSTVFHRQAGMTPTQYRRSHGNSAGSP